MASDDSTEEDETFTAPCPLALLQAVEFYESLGYMADGPEKRPFGVLGAYPYAKLLQRNFIGAPMIACASITTVPTRNGNAHPKRLP